MISTSISSFESCYSGIGSGSRLVSGSSNEARDYFPRLAISIVGLTISSAALEEFLAEPVSIESVIELYS